MASAISDHTSRRAIQVVEWIEQHAAAGVIDYTTIIATLDSPVGSVAEREWRRIAGGCGFPRTLDSAERMLVLSSLRARAGRFGRVARVRPPLPRPDVPAAPVDPFEGLPR